MLTIRALIILILIPLYLNAATKEQWIKYYTRPCYDLSEKQVCRHRLEKAIERMNNYKPMVFFKFKEKKLPTFLAIIPIIESDYNPNAISYINKKPFALGMFQVSKHNIVEYFKRVSLTKFSKSWIISSRVWANPEFSTELACWILDGLWKKYRNWQHVIYAYNAGSKVVDDWIAGKRKLPEQTVNFYQQFLALYEIVTNQKKYGITAKDETEYYTYVIKNELNKWVN